MSSSAATAGLSDGGLGPRKSEQRAGGERERAEKSPKTEFEAKSRGTVEDADLAMNLEQGERPKDF